MPEKWTYLCIDFLSLFVPLLFSFHPRIRFYKQWPYFIIPIILVAIFFILWDILFTYLNIWNFNHKYVLGYYFFNLPIEELIFFICIPYASIFTYYCLRYLTPINDNFVVNRHINLAFGLMLIIAGMLNLKKLYTSSVFLLLGFVLIASYIFKRQNFGAFYVMFLLILIPFFITNGLLTGGYIHRTVVEYNNDYNLGIRLYTIPIEDVFYGMLLLMLNILGFEFLKKNAEWI